MKAIVIGASTLALVASTGAVRADVRYPSAPVLSAATAILAAGPPRRPASRPAGRPPPRPNNRPPVRGGAHTNINHHNNVQVNVNQRDHHHDHWDDDWDDHWHPLATAATVAVTAAVVGSIVHSIPPDCRTVAVNGISYSQCGNTWYQPQYYGTSVQYIVVNPPY